MTTVRQLNKSLRVFRIIVAACFALNLVGFFCIGEMLLTFNGHIQELVTVTDKDIAWLQDNNLRIEEQQVDLRDQLEGLSQELLLLQQSRTVLVRITGYHPKSKTGALARPIVIGRTAAISPRCRELLGRTVYVPGIGMRVIEDLTSPSVDKVHKNMCTLDIAVPSDTPTSKIGNKSETIILVE